MTLVVANYTRDGWPGVASYTLVAYTARSRNRRKPLLIRTLLIKESDVYNYTNNSEHRRTDINNVSVCNMSSRHILMHDDITLMNTSLPKIFLPTNF